MENHFSDQTTILSMKISCCKGCPKILKKKLLKMQGVESVSIDTENDLVYVKGPINPTTLLNKVAKLGKAVQLQPPDEQNYTTNDDDFSPRKTGEMHKNKNCCCKDGRHASNKKVEDEHKCETEPIPSVDARVCRDIFCDAHAFLHKISDDAPSEKHSLFGLGGLFYGGAGSYGGSYGGRAGSYGGGYGGRAGSYGGGYGGGSYPYQAGYGYGHGPRPHGYAPQPRLGPQHPFGYQYRY